MHSSVISRSIFIVIALLVLASCDHGGNKVRADKAREVKSETNSTPAKSETTSPAKPATKAAATRNSRVASAPTGTTTKHTVDYNGITQFNAR